MPLRQYLMKHFYIYFTTALTPTKLKPNRFVAKRVLKSQLALFEKRLGMREDAVKSHQKLRYWTRAMLWHTEISGGGEGGGWIYG
jgi:hypothetical protein